MGDLREAVLDLMADLQTVAAQQEAAEAIGWVALTFDPESDRLLPITGVTGVFATEMEATTWLDGHLLRVNTGNGPDEKPFTGVVFPVMAVDE